MKKKNQVVLNDYNSELEKEYLNEISTNIEYSLKIDPENKYNMSQEQKDFIRWYLEYHNISYACVFSDIDLEKGKSYFQMYSTQQEIKRLHKAMLHKQFSSRLLSLDEIESYLTSILTDDIPEYKKLNTNDKLKVVDRIMAIKQIKNNSFQNPSMILENNNIDNYIKDLSIDSLKLLINQETKNEEKEDTIKKINKNNILSAEELCYLKTLPVEELLDILNKYNEGGKNG